MDNLFSIFVLIGIVNAVVKWFKKQQEKGGQGAAPDKPWQRILGELAQSLEDETEGKKNVPPAVFPPAKQQEDPVIQPQEALSSEGLSPARENMVFGGEGESAPWRGSLPGTEGTVAFTANFSPAPDPLDMPAVAPSPVRLSFDRDNLVQAVVMHEILTRPQDRRRRWGGQ